MKVLTKIKLDNKLREIEAIKCNKCKLKRLMYLELAVNVLIDKNRLN